MLKKIFRIAKGTNSKNNILLKQEFFQIQRSFFARSLKRAEQSALSKIFSQKGEDYVDESGEKQSHIKKYSDNFIYLPLVDHPLIPGYTRLINMTKDIVEKLNAEKIEEKFLCMSVLKNPDQIEGLTLSSLGMPIQNFIPEIKSADEVYDFGCVCEIRFDGGQKEFGVTIN